MKKLKNEERKKGSANRVKAERGRENPKETSTHARSSERGKQRSKEVEHKCEKDKQPQASIKAMQ